MSCCSWVALFYTLVSVTVNIVMAPSGLLCADLPLINWKLKVKGVYSSQSPSYGASPAIWDHTVLPTTRHRCLNPSWTDRCLICRSTVPLEGWKAELTYSLTYCCLSSGRVMSCLGGTDYSWDHISCIWLIAEWRVMLRCNNSVQLTKFSWTTVLDHGHILDVSDLVDKSSVEVCAYNISAGLGWLVGQGLTSHSTQFRSFRRRCFYRSDDPTNSVKALKEGG